ncbi:MAG TPA: tetratricopeptide repeat protein [bacterium]|nr:tetratricopeptide repeat protein [bacterium]
MRCRRHPDAEAVAVCQRCADTLCADCWTIGGRRILCISCEANRVRTARVLRRAAGGIMIAGVAALGLFGLDLAQYGPYAASIHEVRTRLDENPRDAAALVRLAALYRAAGRPGAAADAYRSALAVDPQNLVAHINLGLLYYDVLDLDRAIYHLKIATQIDPGSFEAYRTLGLALERNGDPKGAEPVMRRTLELSPDSPSRAEASRNLARVLERLDRKFEAAQFLQESVRAADGSDAAEERAATEQRIARLRRESDSSAPLLAADAVEVRFRPWGGTIPVKGLLDERVPAAFLVDTGATYTTITSALARELGIKDLEKSGRVHFRAASGDIVAPLVQVRSLRIRDAYVENITVAICDTCGDGLIDGLLGLNFLQRFRVEIDGVSGRLVLRRPVNGTTEAGPPDPARLPAPQPAADAEEARAPAPVWALSRTAKEEDAPLFDSGPPPTATGATGAAAQPSSSEAPLWPPPPPHGK